MKQKYFVLSMDAMVHEDVAYMETKPNFKKIMEKRAEVNGVCSVYPASTYPAHTSLMTGCYPKKHGVFSNFPLRPDRDGTNHWPLLHYSVFAEDDIFAAAKRAGLSTAAVYWPITGKNPNLDHNINEYFFYYDDIDQPEKSFALQGADEVALQAVRENAHLLPTTRGQGLSRTAVFDDFIMGCTCSLIRNAKPDLLMIHNCYLDSTRHTYGAFSEQMKTSLDIMDEWLGWVIEAMEDAGVYEQTNFIILSDHGQMDCTKTVRMNVLLQQEGLQQMGVKGALYDWHAYSQSNGKSTTIHLRDNTNQKLYDRTLACLQKLQADGKYGIEKIWTKDELAETYGQGGPYSFMVEAVDGVQFSDALSGEAVAENKKVGGKHGYQPEKGPQPVFLAHGPAFKEGAVLERASLVDTAPTLAYLMGQTIADADGRVLTELLK